MTGNGHKTADLAPVKHGRNLRLFNDDFERFFDWAARRFDPLLWPTRWGRARLEEEWLPDVDVLERDGKLVVRADLPGLKREDIEVKVEDDMLVIRGKREEKEEVKEGDYYRLERKSGEFSRAIRLPDGVDPATVEASYADGVLEVTVPKPAAPAAKTVAVQVK